MAVQGKICGLTDITAVTAAIDNGARYVGFVFYPPSPRNVTPEQAAALIKEVPDGVEKVGLFVDPTDSLIQSVLDVVSLDWIQLHGSETVERVSEIRETFNLPVLKAIKIANPNDFETAKLYEAVADMLLFDAKAPKDLANALPGGNGLVFDWRMMRNQEFGKPWMLAGGLTEENVEEAVSISGAKTVDTSSGVEFEPGRKNPAAIAAFLKTLQALSV